MFVICKAGFCREVAFSCKNFGFSARCRVFLIWHSLMNLQEDAYVVWVLVTLSFCSSTFYFPSVHCQRMFVLVPIFNLVSEYTTASETKLKT